MTIKVILVDDSKLILNILTDILKNDSEIKIVATAIDPIDAREKIKLHNPDVMILDIEMPKMNGIEFLSRVMKLHPMPVLMCSTLTSKNAVETIKALELGAVDCIEKPTNPNELYQLKEILIDKIKQVARANIGSKVLGREVNGEIINDDTIKYNKLVAIGASTGGVDALKLILSQLPANSPSIVIAQHMPAKFTEIFADRLNNYTKVKVVEAKDMDPILPSRVYIAPGGKNMIIDNVNNRLVCRIIDNLPKYNYVPSVNVLFESVVKVVGADVVGVILTGMGNDGAESMLKMRNAGAHTIGQDQSSCIIYGMPKVAYLNHAVTIELPLNKIAQEILNHAK
jgi:two-component system chemotaxis response regulator CheB